MWFVLRRIKVREHERGLLFEDRDFKAVPPTTISAPPRR
jgi:hypothetical protein